MLEQHAAHVRMDDDRIGRLLRKFRAAQGPPGKPLLGVGGGVLIGDLGQRQPLHADAEPGARSSS